MAEDRARFDIMKDDPRLKKELSKLKRIFKDIEPDKKKLVERLIENAAFMQTLLIDLQEDININGYREKYQNGENQWGYKRSISADLYQTTIKNYIAIIKQLARLLPEPEADEEENPADELLRFIGMK